MLIKKIPTISELLSSFMHLYYFLSDLRSELKAKGMKRMSSSTENSSTSDIPSSSGVESAAVTTAPSSTDSSRTPSAMSSDSSVHPNTGDSTNCTATPPPSTAATTVSKGKKYPLQI